MTSAFHVYFGPEALAATPRVRRIGPQDCFAALKEGLDDFFSMPTYPVFVGLFYAVAGIALFAMTSFGNALHLAFPLAAGFALIGPFVAIGLYEMSRRRERGLAVASTDALTVLRSPALPSILAFGLLLFAVFAAWIFAAELIYVWLYGPNPPAGAIPFLQEGFHLQVIEYGLAKWINAAEQQEICMAGGGHHPVQQNPLTAFAEIVFQFHDQGHS